MKWNSKSCSKLFMFMSLLSWGDLQRELFDHQSFLQYLWMFCKSFFLFWVLIIACRILSVLFWFLLNGDGFSITNPVLIDRNINFETSFWFLINPNWKSIWVLEWWISTGSGRPLDALWQTWKKWKVFRQQICMFQFQPGWN